jgi:hypothetical protein
MADESDEESTGRARSGLARAAALSPERRQEIARAAASARWGAGDDIPEALHEGVISPGGAEIPCYVLKDGTRVLARASFVKAMGRKGKVKGGLQFEGELQMPVFLTADNLKPFITSEIEGNSKPILFRWKGVKIIGYRAELLPDVCDVYQDAQRERVLRPQQVHIAEACRMLGRGLTRLGIIGLIDEATGYQAVRDKHALQAILDKYLRKELAAWAKRFPDEFYRQIFRLRGWTWKGMKVNRPQVVANYTKDFVWSRLAPGILDELQNRMPKDDKGRNKGRYPQLLSVDVGDPALAQHLHAVVSLMKAARNWDEFKRMLNVALPKKGANLELDLVEEP